MICQNELFDISFSLSLIRGDIENDCNIAVVDSIIALLKENDIKNNDVRRALGSVSGLSELWEFVKRENYYVRTVVLDIDSERLVYYLEYLRQLLNEGAFAQGYDFADALHVLPDIMAMHEGKIPKSFYSVYLKKYNKKWKQKIR